ncbi:MAG: single-stranded DNA-binding protein, partial [Planctomycetes bacterium]|nr:single-stranded DNA-binding protein [Planctomycetota bacterium]
TCFIDVVAWRRLAESCGDFLVKGSPVFVEGRLEQDSWETPAGEKRSRIRVVAYSVQFIRREVQRSASGRQLQVVDTGGETVTDSTRSGRIAPAPEDADSIINSRDLDDLS